MSKEAFFTMKLEAVVREEFMAEAEVMHLPASQVLREWMLSSCNVNAQLANTTSS
jgi:hypothetical protein